VGFRLSPRVYPKGISDERSYAESVRRQTDSLARRAASAGDDAERLLLLMSLVNLRLGRQVEPAATRWLLGDESAEITGQIARTAQSAQVELRRAAELLTKLEKRASPPSPGGKPLTHWREVAEHLSALADGMAGVGRAGAESSLLARLEAMGKAKPASVAAAARLWHAALLRQSGRVQEAIARIEPALSKPNELPYDFFLRLLHCRLLSDGGGYAVATALALQMDALCEGWFDKSLCPEAQRAVAAIRVDLAERWADQLERRGMPSHASRRRAVAQRTRLRFFGGQNGVVYRLETAVPMLCEPPMETPQPVSTSISSLPVTRNLPSTSAPTPTTLRADGHATSQRLNTSQPATGPAR